MIYDPKAADNEERSAELFMDFSKECFDEVINLSLSGNFGIITLNVITEMLHKCGKHLQHDLAYQESSNRCSFQS